jgi:hypothetical protein
MPPVSDEHERDEAAEETIEDLEAPAETIADVAGGGCQKYTAIMCVSPSCAATEFECHGASGGGVVRDR